MNGIINIYKSSGLTSHDVVFKLRKILHTKKVGHTGTLDPIAQGVLPICIGNATKIAQFIVEKDKEYIAELSLGEKTDTYDNTGQIIAANKVVITQAEFKRILHHFMGEIDQIPPIYSAIKVNGKKLYEYARENKPVEIKPRKVTILELELLEYEYPIAKIRVACSKGTYIRSLCNDIGEKLGTYGHMVSLIRTKSGPFLAKDALTLEELNNLSTEEIESRLYPIDFPLEHVNRVDIHPYSAKILLNGNPLIQKNLVQSIDDFASEERVRLYLDNEFKGVGIVQCNEIHRIKPLRILS